MNSSATESGPANAQSASFRSGGPRTRRSNIVNVLTIQNMLFRGCSLPWPTRQAWGAANARRGDPNMLAIWLEIAEIAERIAAVRENLRGLVEQAADYS